MSTKWIQYDLFGDLEAAHEAAAAAEREASAAARSFITETPWPGLLAWWLHSEVVESALDRGEVKASYRHGRGGGPGWAWAIWRDGLHFEAGDTWEGWNFRPRRCIAWAELRTIRRAHPEVTAQLQHLAVGRGHPKSAGWRWWADPFVLHPDGWSQQRLDSEQQADWYHGCERPGSAYGDRLEAWRLVLDVVGATNLRVTEKR